MRAFTLDSFDAQPGLRNDIPEPLGGDHELRVRVHASSVNPVDAFVAAGALKDMAEHEFPVILGRDFAGIVDQVGSGVSRYQVGDEVFGFLLHANPTVHDGSWAELITVPEDNYVAAKPGGVDFAVAGAAPLAAITALAAFDALAPAEGAPAAAASWTKKLPTPPVAPTTSTGPHDRVKRRRLERAPKTVIPTG